MLTSGMYVAMMVWIWVTAIGYVVSQGEIHVSISTLVPYALHPWLGSGPLTPSVRVSVPVTVVRHCELAEQVLWVVAINPWAMMFPTGLPIRCWASGFASRP